MPGQITGMSGCVFTAFIGANKVSFFAVDFQVPFQEVAIPEIFAAVAIRADTGSGGLPPGAGARDGSPRLTTGVAAGGIRHCRGVQHREFPVASRRRLECSGCLYVSVPVTGLLPRSRCFPTNLSGRWRALEPGQAGAAAAFHQGIRLAGARGWPGICPGLRESGILLVVVSL